MSTCTSSSKRRRWCRRPSRCNLPRPDSLSRLSAVTVQLGNELKGEGFTFIAVHPGASVRPIAPPDGRCSLGLGSGPAMGISTCRTRHGVSSGRCQPNQSMGRNNNICDTAPLHLGRLTAGCGLLRRGRRDRHARRGDGGQAGAARSLQGQIGARAACECRAALAARIKLTSTRAAGLRHEFMEYVGSANSALLLWQALQSCHMIARTCLTPQADVQLSCDSKG